MDCFNKIGIIGLGLIGGSMAKTIRKRTDCFIYGFDINEEVLNEALKDNSIDKAGECADLKNCDLILIALYPKQTINWIENNLKFLKRNTIIVDLCGVKGSVCAKAEKLCENTGVHFVGGHPMAGREFSGYKYTTDTLYNGASMILVPTKASTDEDIFKLKAFFMNLGFGQTVVTTAENHDKMIAFTSQLAHVVSNAYIKSPEALNHSGYSAGSYRDLTRVARLNEKMWTELFLSNRPALLDEINGIINHLTEYRDALESENADRLRELLRDGSERKKKIDE